MYNQITAKLIIIIIPRKALLGTYRRIHGIAQLRVILWYNNEAENEQKKIWKKFDYHKVIQEIYGLRYCMRRLNKFKKKVVAVMPSNSKRATFKVNLWQVSRDITPTHKHALHPKQGVSSINNSVQNDLWPVFASRALLRLNLMRTHVLAPLAHSSCGP